ncbi:MFS transporter [Amycolatopsis japonica]|uniref:MFS transporter n=1 Tax=Amycolatopsis japonica TaxID=208439 RepID=UPI0033205A88
MREDFAETPGSGLLVRLALTVTSLAIAISAPLSGIVADRVGRRPLLLTGLGLYAVSGTAGFFVGAAAPAPGPHRDHHRQCRAHGRGLAGDRDRGHRRPGRDGTARGRSRRRFRRPEPQPALAALISNRNNGKETR